jgi:hypothetical protein
MGPPVPVGGTQLTVSLDNIKLPPSLLALLRKYNDWQH